MNATGNLKESGHLRPDELFRVIACEMNVDILSINNSTIMPPAAAQFIFSL
jgi:peroxiredoxin family protein